MSASPDQMKCAERKKILSGQNQCLVEAKLIKRIALVVFIFCAVMEMALMYARARTLVHIEINYVEFPIVSLFIRIVHSLNGIK